MIQIQDRINQIMNRIDSINARFNKQTVRDTSFQDTLEQIQEKIYQERLNGLKTKYDAIIKEKADKYNVSENLVKSMIKQESNFDPKAVSPKGAKGLMQLMPQTASLLGVDNAFNPEDNIDGGTKYIRMLLDRFDGNVVKALAAYNAGPETVEKYKGIPDYTETKNYVKNILNYMKKY